jgi:hypothetical protein
VFVGKEWVEPGDTVTAKLWFIAPHFQTGRLYCGFSFTLYEGPNAVAVGRVTNVHSEDLRKRS